MDALSRNPGELQDAMVPSLRRLVDHLYKTQENEPVEQESSPVRLLRNFWTKFCEEPQNVVNHQMLSWHDYSQSQVNLGSVE